jgi:hypothetical protein
MRRLDDHAQNDLITACDLSKPPTAPSLSSHINAVSPSFDHTRHIAVRIRVIENQSNKSFVRSSPVRCKCGASAGPVDSSLRRATDRPTPEHSSPGYSFVGCICWRVRPLDRSLRVCSVYNERRIFSRVQGSKRGVRV